VSPAAARLLGPLLALLAALAPPARAGDAELKDEFKHGLEAVDADLEAWDVEGAAARMAELEKVAPKDAEPLLYYQGRIAFEQGRYGDAVRLLQKSGVQDRAGSYLRLAQDTRDIMAGHQQAESEHFVFFFPKGKDAVLAPYALETLEAQRAALLKVLGHAPPGKVRVEVVDDAEQLAKVSTLTLAQIRATGTIAICKFDKLMVTSPKAVLRGYDWQDTLAHEYVHLAVSQKSRNTVPIWLQEGLAKYFESAWRGAPGLAMTPSMLALLGQRVKKDKLIPFEKMHPSIALLPTALDAATAFAEVFFAVDLLYQQQGAEGLRAIIDALREGKTDQQAVEVATHKPFPSFERSWLAHLRKQPCPEGVIPPAGDQVVLKEDAPAAARRQEKRGKREISYGEFADVTEVQARQFAHLGELMRERRRAQAAAEELGKAHRIVGDKYQAISDKYALALLESGQVDRAEQVLEGSLRIHPEMPTTLVHLGRIFLVRRELEKARTAFLGALAMDPFDPEIHVSLAGIYQAQNRPDLLARAREASQLLTGMKPEQVDEAARMLMARSGAALASKGVGTPDVFYLEDRDDGGVQGARAGADAGR